MRRQPNGPTDPAAHAARPPMDAALFVEAFFDRAAVGVGLTAQGRIVYSNPALQSLLGYSAEELAGMDFTEYTHPDDIPPGHAPDADLLPKSRDYWRQEKRYLTKDGRVVWGRVILYGLPESVLQEQFSLLMVEDITEQKRSEEALGEREQFLRALFGLTEHGIFLARVDGTVLDANPAACALLGMTVEEICARGRTGLVVPGDDIERSLRERAEQGRGGAEVSFLHKDGTTFPAELTSVILPDASPNPRTFIMFKDISQRKRMEEALRQSEGRYQTLVDLSPDALVVQADGKYVFANPAAARLFGAESPREIAGRDMYGLIHPDYHDLITQRAPQVLAGAVAPPVEIKVLSLDGSHVTVEASAARIEFDGRTATQVVFRDITERREAEKLLRLTQFSVDHAADSLFWTNADGRVIYVSDSTCRLHGFSREEMLRMTLFDLDPTLSAEQWSANWKRMKDQGSFIFEAVSRAKNGYTFPVEVTVNYLQFDGEEYNCAFVRDITERKQMEEALRQSEERMRQLQKMEAVGRLAGGIAHDFNNLLTTIIGYSDLMMSDLEFEKTAWFEDVREIKAAAERAGGLTQQILAFSRRQRLQTEVVSVNSLITEIAPLLRRTLGEDIDLVTRLDPDVSMVDIDPQQFTQALMNLAVNARDAMPSGGRLTFTTGNVWLDEGSPVKDPDIAPGSYVRVTVSDTGVGIDPSVVPLIYEPFYTTKPPGQGTGLGLPTVYGVVKQSGGAITVNSTPGEGTAFEIFLPRVNDTQGPESGGTVADDHGDPLEAPAQQRVLVVEDEEAVRRLTERILKQLGYAVQSAANGPEALGILQAAGDPRVDLLLTNVVLPGGLDGGEIARRARALRKDLAVLYVSGYSRNAVLDSGDADQDVYYLEKPFTAEQLAAKVRDALAAAKGLPGSQRTK